MADRAAAAMLSDDDAGSPGDNRLPVALVSPSALALAGLRAVLAPERGFDVVLAVTAWPPRSALAAAAVVVADADAPPVDGDDAEGMGPATVLLVGRTAVRPELLARAAAGTSLIDRDAPADVVAAAVRAAAAGLVCSTAALLRTALPPSARTPVQGALPLEPLTAREREVLDQLSRGIGNREIARALDISVHTAKFHVAQIIAKLDAGSRAQALAHAARAGLVHF